MSPDVFHLFRCLGGEPDQWPASDGQLLERFFRHRDEDAFGLLIQRHGPMVLGVCRRILGNPHDAEDAFQATFLVLVRKGASFLGRETIGNWLYGVAHHTALKAQALAARRRREEPRRLLPPPDPEADDARNDLRQLLDRELSRLPGKYREAVVLCELQGKSRKEAAGLLRIPEGTLSSRLATARRLLAERLQRQGLGPGVAAPGGILAPGILSATVPARLSAGTLRIASGTLTGAGGLSAPITALTDGVLRTMLLNKVQSVAGLFVVLGLIAGLGGGLARGLSQGPTPRTQSAETPQPGDPEQKLDQLIKQLGSEKFKDREAATRELARLGKQALPALEKAAKSPVLEVSRRAQTLINAINPPRESFSILSVNGDMSVPLNGAYKQILIGDVNGSGKVEGMEIDADEVWIGAVNGEAKVTFKGKTKKLRIGAINGNCQIDASNFIAEDVEVAEINGSARLMLHSAGPVRFTGELNGSASTSVRARGDIRFDRIVQGGSTVELTTRGNVLFGDRLGGGTRLKVLLCKDFTVKGAISDRVSAEVYYFGEAKSSDLPRARISLNKVEVPK